MAFSDLVSTADRLVRVHLGEAVTYEPRFGASFSVLGVFSNAYVRAEAGEAGVVSSGPAVFLRLEDLRAALGADYDIENDEPRITRGGVTYRVREQQADGEGGILYLLHEAA